MSGEKLNIYHLLNCQTSSGSLCDACCEYKAVKEKGHPALKGRDFFKRCGEECEFQSRVIDGAIGCSLHPNKLDSCIKYHCSGEADDVKLHMIRLAFQRNLVTRQDAIEAGVKLYPGYKQFVEEFIG